MSGPVSCQLTAAPGSQQRSWCHPPPDSGLCPDISPHGVSAGAPRYLLLPGLSVPLRLLPHGFPQLLSSVFHFCFTLLGKVSH